MSNRTAILISHYSPEPKYWGMPRYHEWGKRLIKEGYDVYILCASTIHSSGLNIIEGKKAYCIKKNEGISYVYIRCSSYEGNGIKRIKNLFDFYFGVKRALKELPRPSVIISESPNPLGAVAGIQYSKQNNNPHIVDVVDLWPESIVVYQGISNSNPLIQILYKGEKWIYKSSDAIIFSTPGAYDYIIEHNWQTLIPRKKVHYINMGVDLKENDYNAKTYIYNDPVFDNKNIFKVVYTGSVRLVNNLKLLCDAGKEIQNRDYHDIFIMIHGAGDQVDELTDYCVNEGINNVKLYGRIEKKYIPYVLANSDLCILCYQNTPLLRFGGSMNKMFDYFASGKPIIANAKMGHSIIEEYNCGIELDTNDPKELADKIIQYYEMPEIERKEIGKHSRNAANDYDLPKLCDKLIDIVNEVAQK